MKIIMKFLGNTVEVNQMIVRQYVDNFIQTAKSDANKAYNLLDEEYKAKKFGSMDNFKNYLSNNLEKIQNSSISKYSAKDMDDYIQYYYIDSNDNTFLIRKPKGKENYTILLDEYTVKEKEYINSYNKLSNVQKVYNNIFIFFRIINEKEYKSAYNLLDETFKQNNFPTVAKFEEYAKSHFWNNSVITIKSIEKQGDIYTGSLKIESGFGLSAEQISKTYAIQLKENAGFVMSFGV